MFLEVALIFPCVVLYVNCITVALMKKQGIFEFNVPYLEQNRSHEWI